MTALPLSVVFRYMSMPAGRGNGSVSGTLGPRSDVVMYGNGNC